MRDLVKSPEFYPIHTKVKGTILMVQRDSGNHFLCAVGIFAGSVILVCAELSSEQNRKSESVYHMDNSLRDCGLCSCDCIQNRILWNERIMLLHPGCSVMQLIVGNRERAFFDYQYLYVAGNSIPDS